MAHAARASKLYLVIRGAPTSDPLDFSTVNVRTHTMQLFVVFVALALFAGIRHTAAVCPSGQMGKPHIISGPDVMC